ncbi:alpha 1,3-glucosidase [Rhizoctonia solani AG-1 IB]|uniref:Alpha 1,3-glucosidase n=1 Tax=Thanatephorus cucumeris (strain AG1-IB / isolate 7/3/14) TaxID=1108050 RepID=A0A0B7F6Z4_THACB|nr:alpha 1,3-glucosidase [Rhizoctonia solani AG-1 IB]
MRLSTQLVLLAAVAEVALGVRHSDFKSCSQSGFCRRGRAISKRADEAGAKWASPYTIDTTNLRVSADRSKITVPVKSSLHPDIKFQLSVVVHEDGTARVRMDEVDGLKKRYDGAADWALASIPEVRGVDWKPVDGGVEGRWDGILLRVTYEPLLIELIRDGRIEMSVNGRGLLHMEHFRNKPEPKVEEAVAEGAESEQKVIKEPEPKINAWFEGDTEDDYWEETFKSWTDSKPKGPESFSLDITFPTHAHVYGIPQHAAPLSLPTTTGEGRRDKRYLRLRCKRGGNDLRDRDQRGQLISAERWAYSRNRPWREKQEAPRVKQTGKRSLAKMRLSTQLILLAAVAEVALGVRHQDFKSCSQSGFCRRGRAISKRANEAGAKWASPYTIDTTNLRVSADRSKITVPVKSSLHPDIKFQLSVVVHEDGTARVRMDEVDGLKKRYDGTADWALASIPEVRGVDWKPVDGGVEGRWDGILLRVTYEPLLIELIRDGRVEMSVNGRGLLHMEHFRNKPGPKTQETVAEGVQGEQEVIKEPEPKTNAWFEGDTEDAYWEETFKSWTDSKPKGKGTLVSS